MSSTVGPTPWLKGVVKAVSSGDSLVIVNTPNAEFTRQISLILASLEAPKLARSTNGSDEPFAWCSREYLRKLCLGKEVVFKVDYTISGIKRDCGSVFLEDQNVSSLIVAAGWAKVRRRRHRDQDVSPFYDNLLANEALAEQQGLGCWTKVPGAAEASLRKMAIVHLEDIVEANKNRKLEASVELVLNGSVLLVYLVAQCQYAKLILAGVQAPFVDGLQVEAGPFGKEAKQFTEMKVLHRTVSISLEGVSKLGDCLVCSVYYPDNGSTNNLALQLLENGLAEYGGWSVRLLKPEAKLKLKEAELKAKTDGIRIWKTSS